MSKIIIFIFLIVSISNGHAKRRGKRLIYPESGVMSVFGKGYITYEKDSSITGSNLTGSRIIITPGFSIFFNKVLDLEISTSITVNTGTLYGGSKNSYEFNTGVNYYSEFGKSKFISIGGLATYSKTVDTLLKIGLKIPVKFIFAIAKNVSLTAGIEPVYYFYHKLNESEPGTSLSIPTGILGIKVFI
jgi:hypothetical protein